jgi:hypothetical protein
MGDLRKQLQQKETVYEKEKGVEFFCRKMLDEKHIH